MSEHGENAVLPEGVRRWLASFEGQDLPSQNLEIILNSFAPLEEVCEGLASWLESARNEFLGDFLEGASVGGPVVAGTEFGPPGGYWAKLEVDTISGPSTLDLDYSAAAWARKVEDLRAGKVTGLGLSVDHLSDRGYPSNVLGGAGLAFSIANADSPEPCIEASMSIARAMLPGSLDPSFLERWVSAATACATSIRAAYGLITSDYGGPAYEEWVGRYPEEGRGECARYVRGYYWGNFLSEGHLRQLGGVDRVLLEAPCYRVEDLSHGETALVYLQSTPHIDDMSDDALRLLKEYLSPVLPAGRLQPGEDYWGPPLRVV